MRLLQLITSSIVSLVGGVVGGYGAQKAIVQWPALAIRRMLILTVAAVGSLVLLLMGASLLLSGLAELSAFYEAPWVFSIAVGAVIGIGGAFGLGMAFRKNAWTKTHPQSTVTPRVSSQNPVLDAFILLVSDYLEERRARRENHYGRSRLDHEVDEAPLRRGALRRNSPLHEETVH
ncbi:MAG: hypothetical protein KF865_09015 [Bdellovibrionaceae bacterium]|nr:hypothetical protein [Pseudobdellovibrionaceae bacterium]